MTRGGLRGRIAQTLKGGIEGVVSAAGDDDAGNVNVVGRHNTVVAHSVGGKGSSRHASAAQSTRVVQRNGTTHSDDTVQTRSTDDAPELER
jgi:hypothetical protein